MKVTPYEIDCSDGKIDYSIDFPDDECLTNWCLNGLCYANGWRSLSKTIPTQWKHISGLADVSIFGNYCTINKPLSHCKTIILPLDDKETHRFLLDRNYDNLLMRLEHKELESIIDNLD